jgi:hypothetical protein
MMVMCVDDSSLVIAAAGNLPPVPLVFGQTYTVYGITEYGGEPYYMLHEIPGRWYIAKRFMKLTDDKK